MLKSPFQSPIRSAISYTLAKSLRWILLNGFWDNSGYWDDSAFWNG